MNKLLKIFGFDEEDAKERIRTKHLAEIYHQKEAAAKTVRTKGKEVIGEKEESATADEKTGGATSPSESTGDKTKRWGWRQKKEELVKQPEDEGDEIKTEEGREFHKSMEGKNGIEALQAYLPNRSDVMSGLRKISAIISMLEDAGMHSVSEDTVLHRMGFEREDLVQTLYEIVDSVKTHDTSHGSRISISDINQFAESIETKHFLPLVYQDIFGLQENANPTDIEDKCDELVRVLSGYKELREYPHFPVIATALDIRRDHPGVTLDELRQGIKANGDIPAEEPVNLPFERIDKIRFSRKIKVETGVEAMPQPATTSSQPEINKGVDIEKFREKMRGEVAISVFLLDKIRAELNESDATKAVFAQEPTKLMDDKSVISAIETSIPGLGIALRRASIDIGKGRLMINLDILKVIVEFYIIDDEMGLATKVVDIAGDFRKLFPQLSH